MIRVQNPSAITLLRRRPLRRHEVQHAGVLSWGAPAEASIVLENDRVRFTFKRDAGTGLRLDTFERLEDGDVVATWTNREADLWRLIAFDTTPQRSTATSSVGPVSGFMDEPVVVTSPNQKITVTWSDVGMGTDRVDVTVTVQLRHDEDFLRADASVAFVGTPSRWAIDSIVLLPLRVDPLDRGQDFAVMPTVFGVEVGDPIRNLIYDVAGNGLLTTFGLQIRNVWTYPSGRGWSMGCFGYYSRASGEGWTGWTEQWDHTFQSIVFQSDGHGVLLEAATTCPDNLCAGNQDAILKAGPMCLRPIETTHHGWNEVAKNYRDRIELVNPSWLPEKRWKRGDLSDTEKGPFLFLDANHAGYGGATAFLVDLVTKARMAVGVTQDVPVFLIAEMSNQNTLFPNDTQKGDAGVTFAALRGINCHAGQWRPEVVGADVWDGHKFAQEEIRWWTTAQAVGALRASRVAFFFTDGIDRLAERGRDQYYHERNFPITAWDGTTRTLTVDGTPNGDPLLAGKLFATLVPADPTARLAGAEVQSLGSGSVVVKTGFLDINGVAATPLAGDSVEVWTLDYAIEQVQYCTHAILGSDDYLARHVEDAIAQAVEINGNSHLYVDAFTNQTIKQPVDQLISCYRNHEGWGLIEDDYIQHPLGGGDWYVKAQRGYLKALRGAARNRQESLGREKAFMLSTEDVDEQAMDVVDYCWHGMGAGDLLRVTHGADPARSKYRAVPLFPAVHAGRVFGRALLHEMSTVGMASASPAGPSYESPKNDPVMHRTFAYELGSEWVYGMTVPTLSFWADAVNGPDLDIFDDTRFRAGGGDVNDELRLLRDLWVQMNQFEVLGGQKWLRHGSLAGLAVVDFDATDFTTGFADSLYTGQYVSYDVVYDREQYPRVAHACWTSRDDDGSAIVLLVNWTEQPARWRGTLPMQALGFASGAPVAATTLDAALEDAAVDTTFTATTGVLDVPEIAPYTVLVVKLAAPIVDAVGADFGAGGGLVVGQNSYVTQAEADAYAAASNLYAGAWSGLPDDRKTQLLITAWRSLEREAWQGTPAGLSIIDAARLTSGGFDYVVGDLLYVAGGTGRPATFVVMATATGGMVTGLALLDAGAYSVLPTLDNLPSTDGIGGGAELELEPTGQQLAWPRTGGVYPSGVPITSTDYPPELTAAQIELALYMIGKPAIEAGASLSGNVQSVDAKGVGVKFFAPTIAVGVPPRFPPIVMQLLAPLRGPPPGGAPFVGENGGPSRFDRPQFPIADIPI